MVATEARQEGQDNSIENRQENSCPPSPYPDFKIPTFSSDYEQDISDLKKEQFKAIQEEKQRKADEAYALEKQKAEVTRAEAKSKNDFAIAKYDSAIEVINKKTENGLKALEAAYNQCLRDAGINDCSSEDKIAQHKKAVCVVTLIRDLWVKQIEIDAERQKQELAKSAADADWTKAKTAYNLEIDRAKALRCKAYQDAEVEWREKLREALEENR